MRQELKQGTHPWPGPPLLPPTPIEPPIIFSPQVVVERHAVNAVIEGQVAQVEVTQVLRNLSGRVAEGVYVFPLPADATVSDFQMTVDDHTLEGKLLDSEEARRIYEQIVRNQRDPALLEYLGRGLFQTSVFPIPAGETRTVRLAYSQLLKHKDGLHRFDYPLRASHRNAGAAEEIALRIELRNLPGLRTIYSPNYPIMIERLADDHAVVLYKAAGAEPTGDFDLYFGVEKQPIGVDLLSYKPAGEDGYFLLLAAPALEVAAEEVVARDLIVVIDLSLHYGVLTPYTSYLVSEPDAPALSLDAATQAPTQLALPDVAQLRTQGVEIAANAYAAPAAGATAVIPSQERRALLQAETTQTIPLEMRYVAGRAFVLRSYVVDAEGRRLPAWVDTRYQEEMETTVVAFASDAYCALLDEPGMAQALGALAGDGHRDR